LLPIVGRVQRELFNLGAELAAGDARNAREADAESSSATSNAPRAPGHRRGSTVTSRR